MAPLSFFLYSFFYLSGPGETVFELKMAKHFIQFMHPGIEHGPKWGSQWNAFDHKRKFMRAAGEIWDAKKKQTVHHKSLLFWGEWEAQSDYTVIGRNCPKYCFEPYLDVSVYPFPIPYKSPGLQTTDPLVFAPQFYYSTCKQVDNTGKSHPTLTQLDSGSVILFGSRKKINGSWKFLLDTVFVVGDYRDYTDGSYVTNLARFIPTHYPLLTHLYPSKNPHSSKRCYKGATPEYPVDGMFSYVPCKIQEGNIINGFERPIINIDGISSDLLQGIKILKLLLSDKTEKT